MSSSSKDVRKHVGAKKVDKEEVEREKEQPPLFYPMVFVSGAAFERFGYKTLYENEKKFKKIETDVLTNLSILNVHDVADDRLPACYPLVLDLGDDEASRRRSTTSSSSFDAHDLWARFAQASQISKANTWRIRMRVNTHDDFQELPLLRLNAVRDGDVRFGNLINDEALDRFVTYFRAHNIPYCKYSNAIGLTYRAGVSQWPDEADALSVAALRRRVADNFFVHVDTHSKLFKRLLKNAVAASYERALASPPLIDLTGECSFKKEHLSVVTDLISCLLSTLVFRFLPVVIQGIDNTTKYKLQAEGTPILADNPVAVAVFVLAFLPAHAYADWSTSFKMDPLCQCTLYHLYEAVHGWSKEDLASFSCLLRCRRLQRTKTNPPLLPSFRRRFIPTSMSKSSGGGGGGGAAKKRAAGEKTGAGGDHNEAEKLAERPYTMFYNTFMRMLLMKEGGESLMNYDMPLSAPDCVQYTSCSRSNGVRLKSEHVLGKDFELARDVLLSASIPSNCLKKYDEIVGVPLAPLFGITATATTAALNSSSTNGAMKMVDDESAAGSGSHRSVKKSVASSSSVPSHCETSVLHSRKKKRMITTRATEDSDDVDGGAVVGIHRDRRRHVESVLKGRKRATDKDDGDSGSCNKRQRTVESSDASAINTAAGDGDIDLSDAWKEAIKKIVLETLAEQREKDWKATMNDVEQFLTPARTIEESRRRGDVDLHDSIMSKMTTTATTNTYETPQVIGNDDSVEMTSPQHVLIASDDDDVDSDDVSDESSLDVRSQEEDEAESSHQSHSSDSRESGRSVMFSAEKKTGRRRKIDEAEYQAAREKIDSISLGEEEEHNESNDEGGEDDDDYDSDDDSDDDSVDDSDMQSDDDDDDDDDDLVVDESSEIVEEVDAARLKHITLGDVASGEHFVDDDESVIIITQDDLDLYRECKKLYVNDDMDYGDASCARIRAAWKSIPKEKRKALQTYLNGCVMDDWRCISYISSSHAVDDNDEISPVLGAIEPIGTRGKDIVSTLAKDEVTASIFKKYRNLLTGCRKVLTRTEFLRKESKIIVDLKKKHNIATTSFNVEPSLVVCSRCRHASSLEFAEFKSLYENILDADVDASMSTAEREKEIRTFYDALAAVVAASPSLPDMKLFPVKSSNWCVASGRVFHSFDEAHSNDSDAAGDMRPKYVRVSPQESAIPHRFYEMTIGRRLRKPVYFEVATAPRGYPCIFFPSRVDTADFNTPLQMHKHMVDEHFWEPLKKLSAQKKRQK